MDGMNKSNGCAIERPEISVVLFSCNFEKFIAEAVESVINQTLTPFEIIICDDHSSDDSWKIISSYAEKHPGLIRSFRHQHNIGPIRNGKFGKEKAQGDLVSIIDGDDRWLPRKLELEWKALINYPGAKVAYSNVILIDKNGKPAGCWYDGKGGAPPSGDVFVQTFAKRFFPNRRSIFRNQLMCRNVIQELGYDDDAIDRHADWDLKIRMAARYPVAYSGQALVEYRIHDSGIHRTRAKDLLKSTQYVIQKNSHLLKERTNEERRYVIENLKTLVERDYQYGLKYAHPGKKPNRRPESARPPGYRGHNLIFIISQPRAGSTLLQRLLGGHPEIHTTAEPWIMLHPLYALKDSGLAAEFDVVSARQGTADFISQVPEGRALYVEALQQMGGTLYNRILEVSGKRFFVDKTPRYYLIIDELKCVFPEAKFIILLRNPLAVLSSTLKTWFQNDPALLMKSPNSIDVMKGPLCLVQGMRQLNTRAIILRYEHLAAAPEQQVSDVCRKIGLRFHPEMLIYGNKPKPKGRFGDAVGIAKHEKAVPDYVEKWVDHLNRPELTAFSLQYLELLGPEIFNQLGYPYRENRSKLEQMLKTRQRSNGACCN